jgi:hypothetical protein
MKKEDIFFILKVIEDFGTDPHLEPDPHLHPDQLVRGTDPRIRGPYPDPYQNVTDPEHCL